MVVGTGRIRQLVEELEPSRRVWVNYPDGWMIGGVYRDADGSWFVYSGDVTEGASDADDAFRVLAEIIFVTGVRVPAFGEEAYR